MVHFGLGVAAIHFSKLEQVFALVEALNDDLAQVTHNELFSL